MEGLWPIIIIWVLFALFGRKRQPKRPPARLQHPGAEPGAGRSAQGGFYDELNRALEELKRTEAQARIPPAQPPQWQAGAGATARAEPRRESGGGQFERGQRLEVFQPGPRPADRLVRRPVRPLEDDDADKSSELEEAMSLEGIADYDDDAERLVEERVRAADRGRRRDESSEELSATQLARRAGRVPVALGTASEHREWHQRAEPGDRPEGKPGPRARAAPLARWADGTARSALILSEILGRPAGDR